MNSFLNNKLTSHTISSIINEGKLINNFNQIANCFNNYFINIGPNLARNIPSSNASFIDYLNHPNPNSLFLLQLMNMRYPIL